VAFVEQVRNMHAWGVRTFLEVGPGHTLTGLVQSILEGQPHQALALDASRGKRSNTADLARVLAQLLAAGHAVDLTRWDPIEEIAARGKSGLTVALGGANYVTPRPT